MRLGQLARKLSLRQAQIIEFLAQNNIQIEENSNLRMDDAHVEIVVKNFAPESLEQISQEVDEPEVIVTELEQVIEPVVNAMPEIIEEVASEENTQSEIIRVQKIELSGLKVLGKIELPEPKKKEQSTEAAAEGEAATQAPEEKTSDRKRKPKRDFKERPHRQWKNPVELQREREAREAEDKRRNQIEREKEKRKRHYEEKRKSMVQPKRAKATKTVTENPKRVDNRPVPKTWFGKFLRWWTT